MTYVFSASVTLQVRFHNIWKSVCWAAPNAASVACWPLSWCNCSLFITASCIFLSRKLTLGPENTLKNVLKELERAKIVWCFCVIESEGWDGVLYSQSHPGTFTATTCDHVGLGWDRTPPLWEEDSVSSFPSTTLLPLWAGFPPLSFSSLSIWMLAAMSCMALAVSMAIAMVTVMSSGHCSFDIWCSQPSLAVSLGLAISAHWFSSEEENSWLYL